MAEQLLKSVLITSLAGTALAVFITLLKPFTKRIFGSAWHYYIWLTVLIVMILPVRFTVMSNAGADIITADTQQAYTVPTAEISAEYQGEAAALPQRTVQSNTVKLVRIAESGTDILCAVWLLGMILSFLITAVGYIQLIRKVLRNSVVISCPEIRRYTKRKITVRICGGLSSPFIMGISRPSLILPDVTLTPVQLDNILRHETTHLKRNDVLYKWFAAIVKAIHWFNPAAYYAARQIAEECEISCDLSVTKNMNGEQKLSYVNTIISLLSPTVSRSVPLTTGMTGNKKMLRRRFIMIKNKKSTSKIVSVLSAIIAVIMLGTTVFASGALADMTTNANNQTVVTSASENGSPEYTIEQFFQNLEAGQYEQAYRYCVSNLTGLGLDQLGQQKLTSDITVDYNMDWDGQINAKCYAEFIDDEHLEDGFAQWDIYLKQQGNRYLISGWGCQTFPSYSPENTVYYFFNAFEQSDFESMKQYCTQEFIDEFFGNGYVFGMERASLIEADDHQTGYGNSSNDFNMYVTVSMKPTENSIYMPEDSQTSFNIQLIKQSDGRYLINEFGR